MTRWEQVWASEVLNAFTVEGAPGLNVLPGEVDYVGAFSRMRRGSTALASVGLRVALWMVILAPLWLLGRVGTFSALALRDRTELLSRLLCHSSFIDRSTEELSEASDAFIADATGNNAIKIIEVSVEVEGKTVFGDRTDIDAHPDSTNFGFSVRRIDPYAC